MRTRTRLLLLAAAVLLAAAIWHLGGLLGPREPVGPHALVEVVDRLGRPVKDARVRSRYVHAWTAVDHEGRARLHAVVLRAGEEPSPDALAEALEVEAPWWALPPGRRPEVVPGPGGVWRVRAVLERYGRLRLRVRATREPEVRARAVGASGPGLLEAEGDVAVARPDRPASWRVYEGATWVEVDLEGPSGVAAHRCFVEAPSPGYVRELDLAAEPARPIAGRVLPPTDGAVPDLAGRLEVLEQTESGDLVRQAYDVLVAADGSFEVPFAGAGRYRLVPHLDFAEADAVWGEGGGTVEIGPVLLRPWLVLDLADAGGAKRPGLYDVTRAEDGWHGTWTRVEGDRVLFVVPGTGRYDVRVVLGGDAEREPRAGEASVLAEGPGPHALALDLRPLPAGTVQVRLAEGTVTKGAAVRVTRPLPERTATILPPLGSETAFAHVPAGPVEAVVTFREAERAAAFLAGDLAEGGTLALTATAVDGGLVRLEGRGPGLADDERDRVLRWGPATRPTHAPAFAPDGVGPGEIVLRRVPGTPRWEARERLAPGTWHVDVLVAGHERPALHAARLEVRPGATATLVLEVPE